jgi:hypothetical protein
MTDSSRKTSTLAVDAHVHLYADLDLCKLFTSAYANLTGASDNACEAVLVLTESSAEDGFKRLRKAAQNPGSAVCSGEDEWFCTPTAEPDSLRLSSGAGKSLFVIAGSQLVVREGLEVHALATSAIFSDGKPLMELIQDIKDAGGIAAMPWGAGKWLGKRGSLMKSLCANLDQHDVLLSDSGIRPWLWPRPGLFNSGLGVIAGTDPLPIADEAGRAGSFGFTIDGPWDPDRPAASLRDILREQNTTPLTFGQSQGVMQFISRQLQIRR